MPKFKALAACVSLVAISLPFSSEADSVLPTPQLITTGTPATIGLNNGLAEFVDNANIKLGGTHNLLTSGNHRIRSIDISGNNSIFTVSHDVFLGSVGNSSSQTGNFLTILYVGAQTITLSGDGGGDSAIGINDYSGLGVVDYNNNPNCV